MLKRLLVTAFGLAAICGIALVPASESAAAGSLAVSLFCEPEPNGAICGGSPAGSGNTFAWSTTGNLMLSSFGPGTGSLFQIVSCYGTGRGGTVTVTVTAPNGDSGSATRWVGCSQGWPF